MSDQSQKINMLPPDNRQYGNQIIRANFQGDLYDWNTAMLNLQSIHKQYTGKGVSIGILDTGFHSGHPDLIDNIERRSFVTEDGEDTPTVTDLNGHGTHVRGIISMQKNGSGFVGVAPDATLRIGKVLDRFGAGDPNAVAAAIEWLVDTNTKYINLSLGMEFYHKAIADVIKMAHSKGHIIVAASGNASRDQISFPANMDEVIAAGAIDSKKVLTWFSNTGVAIDILAPGHQIRSAWIDNQYKMVSGTSQATPHVTGILALYEEYYVKKYSIEPTFEDINHWLASCSEDIGLVGRDDKHGHGLITTNFDHSDSPVIEQPQDSPEEEINYSMPSIQTKKTIAFVLLVVIGALFFAMVLFSIYSYQ